MAPSHYPSLGSSSAGRKQVVIPAVFAPLAVLAVALRLWSRSIKRKKLELNDYAAILGLLFTLGLVAITWLAVFWAGAGHHFSNVDPQYRNRIFFIFSAGQPVWAAANTAVKFSILHLYITIFPSRRFRICCYATLGLSFAYFLSVLLETFLLCKPVQFNWDKTIVGTCSNGQLTAYILAGTINLTLDVFILALPMPMLWSLRMPLAKKIGVIGMFSLGGVICIISLLRIVNIAKMDLADFTYAMVDLAVWSILEPMLGVINACLPVLRPVGVRLFDSAPFQSARTYLRSFLTQRSLRGTTHTGSGGINWSKSKSANEEFRKLSDTMDRMYPLDTLAMDGDIETNQPRR